MKYLIIIWMSSVVLAGGKTLIDQYRLLKLYKEEINPSYPIVFGEKSSSSDPLGLMVGNQWIKIMFGKHEKHPELAALASKVRRDFFTIFAVMIGGFILLTLLIYTSRSA